MGRWRISCFIKSSEVEVCLHSILVFSLFCIFLSPFLGLRFSLLEISPFSLCFLTSALRIPYWPSRFSRRNGKCGILPVRKKKGIAAERLLGLVGGAWRFGFGMFVYFFSSRGRMWVRVRRWRKKEKEFIVGWQIAEWYFNKHEHGVFLLGLWNFNHKPSLEHSKKNSDGYFKRSSFNKFPAQKNTPEIEGVRFTTITNQCTPA